MNRKQAKKWLPEITHWANGGNLWFYDRGKWKPFKHSIKELFNFHDLGKCVMEDKHFETRKAHALGEPIEIFTMNYWHIDDHPKFEDCFKYRPKKKEWYHNISKKGVLCWVWDNNYNKNNIAFIQYKKPNNFLDFNNISWKYAKPIKPEECYQENY